MVVKYALLVALILMAWTPSEAQRPFYAGRRPVIYPKPQEQYESERADSDLGLRLGVPSSSVPGSLHDDETLNRVGSWPRERQPFWFINNRAIAEHRGFQFQ